MNEINDYVKVSIIDYIGKVENGVAILMNLIFLEKSYEFVYWISENGNYRINFENNFLNEFHIKDIYKFPPITHLIKYLDNEILPPKKDIFDEFLNKKEEEK